MKTQAEVQQALTNVENEIAGLDNITCNSERTDAYAKLPKMRAEVEAFKWVLAGEQPLAYLSVDSSLVEAFQHYLDHYHDQEEEALDESAKEHYQDWLDTREPGDEYAVSENDHSLDPIEPRFEVVKVDESEFGKFYHLTFPTIACAMEFGLGWSKAMRPVVEARVYPAALTPELDAVLGFPNFACAPFAQTFRAAGYDIPPKAEREQAFVLHWLTGLVLEHGAGWKDKAMSELVALRGKVTVEGDKPND